MKAVAYSGIASLLILLTAGAVFSAPIVYGIRDDHVVKITASSGHSTEVGGALGLDDFSATTPSAFDPVSRTLYLACKKAGDKINWWWWKIDVTTGQATSNILPLPAIGVDQYFYDPTDGLAYGLRGNTVVTVNPATGQTVGNIRTYALQGVSETTPATYDPLGNILYVAANDSADGKLKWWQINTVTGVANNTYLASSPGDGLEYHVGSTSIYGVRGDTLVRVNRTSGTSIGFTPPLKVDGFDGATPSAFNPVDGAYYISAPYYPSHAPYWWNVVVSPVEIDAYPAAQNYTLYSDYYRVPIAEADGKYKINSGDMLVLKGGSSTVLDIGAASYAWDLDDDGIFETNAGNIANFKVPYAVLSDLGLRAGRTYTIHLQVADAFGEVDTDWSTLTILAVVPEPATLGLALMGIAVFALVRRRRRRT